MKTFALFIVLITLISCQPQTKVIEEPHTSPFLWENATIYFLLTDRFLNADKSNDNAFGRKQDGAVLRSFEGGDLQGITQKIDAGYFNDLGVNALWLSPHVEQIKGSTDEGTGKSYGYHGYWAADWTAVDPNYGTMEDFQNLVNAAHAKGIRVLLDVVINHTGPVNPADMSYPESWVRLDPPCTFKDAVTTIECVLVKGLPDVRTDSDDAVELPPVLVEKWKKEGRYEQEVQELNTFFERTGLPRSPRHYIMKWHLDWIRDFGVDGFRVDTVKHTEGSIWGEFKTLAAQEFEQWKKNNPDKKISDDAFYMTGEVYGYGIQSGRKFYFNADDTENYYDLGFDSLINFSLKGDAKKPYEELFSDYSQRLQSPELSDVTVVNYISSHDDSYAFDHYRERPFESANKLLLSPGVAQIYYGDESARVLDQEGAVGDAKLRSNMNWQDISENAQRDDYAVGEVLKHWQKLGKFRQAHVSVGAGIHQKISDQPYTFMRSYSKNDVQDTVVIALDLATSSESTVSPQTISVKGAFKDGELVHDAYSQTSATVRDQQVVINTPFSVVLLEKSRATP